MVHVDCRATSDRTAQASPLAASATFQLLTEVEEELLDRCIEGSGSFLFG